MKMIPIPGWEDRYLITEHGQVFSIIGGRFLAERISRGYRKVDLKRNGKKKSVNIHRLISLVWFNGARLDHIDRNPLNNALSNLRPATQSQNMANKAMYRSNKSGFRGVSWSRERKKWVAQLSGENRTTIPLGRYSSKEEAAKVYDVAAKARFGEFAQLNFPDSAPESELAFARTEVLKRLCPPDLLDTKQPCTTTY